MNLQNEELRNRTLFWTALIAIVLVSLWMSDWIAAAELAPVRVENIAVEKAASRTRVVITSSAKVRYEVLELDAPPRLVVDLHHAIYSVTEKVIPVGNEVILQIRSGQFLATPVKIVRVVLDLERSCPYTITQRKGQITILLVPSRDDSAAKSSEADSVSVGKDSSREQLISLNLQGLTLENALKILTQKTGLNFIMSPALSGIKVDVYLRDVPVEGALSTILKANGLWYEKQIGTNIYIIKKLKGIPPDKLVEEIIGCEYASAADMRDIIRENLSSDGTFTVDQRTNSVILSDVPASVARVKKILAELDRPSKQVLIEVKIVEINLTAASELGVSWDWADKAGEGSPVGAATLKHSFGSIGEGILNLSIGKYASDVGVRDLKSAITALEKQGSADLLASPKILALDGKSASIRITENIAIARKISYQATAAGQMPVEEPVFGDVGVMLTVTPYVLNERFTTLEVKTTVSSAGKSTYFPDQAVDTQERTAETSVMVEDGQTIVIGGLFRKDQKKSISKVPLLGNIPILGYLFRRTITDTIKTEVTVFLTPHILSVEKP